MRSKMLNGQLQYKRNLFVGVLGYLQVLPRGTGCVVLNTGQAQNSVTPDVEVLSGTQVAELLRKSITALYGEFVTVDGAGVDYSALRASQEFKAYVALSAQLTQVDPLTMDRNERLSFFINVYNSLTIHAVAQLGAPADLLSRLRLYAEASYRIGAHTYSLNDIENGVLRGNRSPPTINPLPKKPFGPADPRAALACKEVDARIHFALNCAARGCPPIRFYKPDNVLEKLDLAARAFCGSVSVKAAPEPKVILSQIFEWYAPDFAPPGVKASAATTLEYILPFLETQQQATLQGILKDRPKGLKGVVTFAPYDWGLNSK